MGDAEYSTGEVECGLPWRWMVNQGHLEVGILQEACAQRMGATTEGWRGRVAVDRVKQNAHYVG